MELTHTEAWLRLINAAGLGSVRINRLIQYFGDAQSVVQQSSFPDQLQIPKRSIDQIKSPDQEAIDQSLRWLEQPLNHLVTIHDALYPELLRNSESPPCALFVKGDVNQMIMPQLAVIGSRNATRAGRENAQAFCRDLAADGLVITSGLALGIDSVAHQSALQANGKTIAVMGTGINQIYPKQNKSLAQSIVANGAVISEFPLNTAPSASHFPLRNRIITGLSLGTLVVEAGVKSGSLITARLTMENNRPVMAIPGSIHSPLSRGCHMLIKQGARLVESADEILEELSPLAQALSVSINQQLSKATDSQVLENNSVDPKSNLTAIQSEVLSYVKYEPTPLEEIVNLSQMPIQSLSSILLILELESLVEKLPGAQYQRL